MDIPDPKSLGDGIHLLPVPLPFRSPAWVNCYAVETSDGVLLLDCGSDWEDGRAALRAGFDAVGLEESAVHTLVVSHLHLDHVGMSARLLREWGCRFVMHERAATLVHQYNDTPAYVSRLGEMALNNGVPEPMIEPATRFDRPSYMPVIDPPDHTVIDGDHIDIGNGRSLEVLHTPGHDQSHICLRDSLTGVFFSGDHVLPRISPVIMWFEEYGDVLGQYLASLDRLLGLDIGTTYPAHGALMEHGEERIRQLIVHHDRRLHDMADLVHLGDTTAFEVMLQSFRPNLEPVQARLAFLETLAHLEHLRETGRVQRREHDGIIHYGP